jgi:hypothetical protein
VSGIVQAYLDALYQRGARLDPPDGYRKVTHQHKHPIKGAGRDSSAACWYVNLNTYSVRLHTAGNGSWTIVKPDAPVPDAVWQHVEAEAARLVKQHPGQNLCTERWIDEQSFRICHYMDGYYPPCKHLAERRSYAALLHAKAVAAEPQIAHVSVMDTDPVRLWTAFFQAYPDALDDVYVDRYLFQQTLTLCIDGDTVQQFVNWVVEGQSISRDDAWARYTTGMEGPLSYIHTLPFTPRQCPRALRLGFVHRYGWVYILSIEGSSHLKIGYSLITPQQRLAQMQVGAPQRLTLLGAYATTRTLAPKLESFVHRVLKDARQGKSEWFAVDLPTAQQACITAIQQEGDMRYFWTYEQWDQHNEAEEERPAEYYEQYPWEDPDNEEWLMKE